MNITLTPEIEQVLSKVAKKRGATVESVVLKTLRERFFYKESKKQKRSDMNSMADMLNGYIGTIDSDHKCCLQALNTLPAEPMLTTWRGSSVKIIITLPA